MEHGEKHLKQLRETINKNLNLHMLQVEKRIPDPFVRTCVALLFSASPLCHLCSPRYYEIINHEKESILSFSTIMIAFSLPKAFLKICNDAFLSLEKKISHTHTPHCVSFNGLAFHRSSKRKY